MRGGLSLGGPKQTFASDITTSYNPTNGVYTAEMLSRGGMYRVEAWDMANLYAQLDAILQNEYLEMTKGTLQQQPRPFGSGLEKHDNLTRHREHGVNVITMKPGDPGKSGSALSKLMGAADVSSIMFAAMRGDWASVLMTLLSKAIEDYITKEGPQHGQEEQEDVFAAEFGGVVITAATPALLAKKLLLQKNKRIQTIMNHMRSHEHNRENASTVENIGKGMYGRVGTGLSSRMKRKKIVAERSWRAKALPHAEEESGWRGKALNLRNGIATKREDAKMLWTERV